MHAPKATRHILAPLLALACLLAWTAPAMAGLGATPERCEKLGKITIQCYTCLDREYVGDVTVNARYDPVSDSCLGDARQPANRCIAAYHMGQLNMYITYKYSVGWTTYKGEWSFLNSCDH